MGEHGFGEGSLECDLIAALVGQENIAVHFSELPVNVVALEVDKLVFDVPHSEERKDFAACLVKKVAVNLVGVLVGERGLGVRECLVKVDLVPHFVHLFQFFLTN